jgi:hypothetical protein
MALAACSLGGGSNALPGSSSGDTPAVQNVFGPSATASLAVTIVVPKSTTAADFTSPGTQSLVVIEGKKIVGTFNTTKSTKGCKKSSKGLTCTFIAGVQTGKQVFIFKTYDQKDGKGGQLAQARVVKSIVAGTNKITLTLRAIMHSIVVGLSEPQPIIGKSATIDVIVTVLDAAGAVLVGKYPATVTLSNSDTSGATQLSGTKVPSSSTSITLTYNGSSSLASATINAKASGVKAANIIPGTLTPSTVASETISGTAAFTVFSDGSGNVAAYIPTNGLSSTSAGAVITVTVAKNGVIQKASTRAPNAMRSSLKLNPAPDECAPDVVHAQIYCMSFHSNIISILSYDPSNVLAGPTLVGQTTTDAGTTGVSFSGATCIICGIAFDPNENGYIIATANGYEIWPTTPGATTPIKTLPAPISENFGYNAVTDQIFSAWYGFDTFSTTAGYSGLDVIDIVSGNRYLLNSSSVTPSEPDAGAVDTHTNIAFAPEEGSVPIYIDNLNGAPYNTGPAVYTAPTPFPTPTPAPPVIPTGTYTSPVVSPDPGSALIKNCDETYTAADSVKDYAFFGSEYCGSDYIAVGQLPTSSTGTLAFSNFVAAMLPNLPNGNGFESPLDPHAVLVVNIPRICGDCGILFNYDKSFLAVVDLNKMLALNPGGGTKDIPTTNKLSGIVTYVATGASSPPSDFARALERTHKHRFRR